MKKGVPANIVVLSSLFVILISLFQSCTDSDDVGDNYRTFEGETIKDFLDNNSEYSLFEQAMEATGSLPLMSGYGKYTCFLPDNDAVNEFLRQKGYSSLEELIDTMPALRQFVYYHIIDGESEGKGNYQTNSFSIGNIETKNMAGRYLYTTPSDDGISWMINSVSRITEANIPMVNGVVHKVDRVVEGNNKLLSEYIYEHPDFQLYAKALQLTGLSDSIMAIEDEVYAEEAKVKDKSYGSYSYPQRRLYGYTALLETDSVLALNGINTVDDMREYAKRHYDGGEGLADNDPNSPLYRFVAYHLIDCKLTTNELCPARDMTVTKDWEVEQWLYETFRDGKYSMDNFLFPMARNTIIGVQQFYWRSTIRQTPVFNDLRNPYDPKWNNFTAEADNVVTIDQANSNQDCLNGILHPLTGMLYYREDIFHKRMRMDFALFMPEMWNNGLRNTNNLIFRQGYFKNIKYEDKDGITLNYFINWGNHSFWLGDKFQMSGRCNVDVTIGPIPSGSYEVRIGYHVVTGTFGVVQYYLDGEPCGIPLDQSISSKDDPEIGFVQVWDYLYGGTESNPIMSWNTGRETPDDWYGYDNDKAMHNRGYMKAPDSYAGQELANGDTSGPIHAGSARNDTWSVRRVLKLVTWPTTTTHTLRISNLMDKSFDLDYIEFIPKDMIENEDTH
ncbi:MAG: fasciclin domain-containing protein [Prevotella sp.]